MQRRISVPQKGIEAQKLFTEFLGFFIAYDLQWIFGRYLELWPS